MRERRWLQFSLATLLALTTVAAFAAHWFAQDRRAEAARHEYQAAAAKYDVGTATADQIELASKQLLEAELHVPFFSRREAKTAYLNRTARLERRVRHTAEFGMFLNEEGFRKTQENARRLRAEREQLESELGVKAED